MAPQMLKLIELTKELLLSTILTKLQPVEIHFLNKIKKSGLRSKRPITHLRTQIKEGSMIQVCLLMRKYQKKKMSKIPQSFMNSSENASNLTESLPKSNLFLILVMKILLSMKYTNSISIGINSKPGENSVNMMNMMRKRLKTDTKEDGCKMKTKEEERSMKKQKEKGF